MRYLRLYLYFMQFSISRALEFRLDFTFRIVMDMFYYLVNILFFKVIYLHTPMLAGWSSEQVQLFVATFLIVDGISMTVFSSNMWWIPELINKGGLDYYLIRPVSSLFFVSTRDFSVNSLINLFMAMGIFIYALIDLPGEISFLKLLFFIVLIINGTLLHYLLHLLLTLPIFWTHSSRGFVDLFYSLGMAMERPHRIYKGGLRIVFNFLLPFTLIASVPAQLYMEAFDVMTFVHLTVVTAIFWMLILFIWKKGLKNYSSASS